MFATFINDCNSANDFGRQATRIFRLFGNIPVITVSIGFGKTLEASGNLIDMLDASDGEKGILLLNAAPRHGTGKKWHNGTPFGYFYYKETLVVATIDGYCLSLAKKIGLFDAISLTDCATVIDTMIKQKHLDAKLRNLIVKSQFRSFDYMPRLAKWIMDGIDIPHEKYSVDKIAEAPKAIWLVDNFGNCKTTVFPEEVGHSPGKVLKTKIGGLICYERLKDVPDNKVGITIGSSGLGLKRFLEIVVSGESAAQRLKLKVGAEIF